MTTDLIIVQAQYRQWQMYWYIGLRFDNGQLPDTGGILGA